ncbi:MAG TPA: hypothetical protein DCY13_21160, partial [Verrucomicrobiales bacterium]|nr:hypothetical protein [Verrucomicrobiales bacterium]
NPGAEPVLFAFIEAVCRAVKAPMPRRVDLDCHLNAAAGFRKGFLSFLGSDLVLLIGLPLAGNLTVAELAGVLAHEFGHFSQGLGMRVSYLVRSVNGWFARVVYERDAFDVSLQEAAEQAEGMAELILFNLARLGVGFSRLILTGLMYLGHGISCFMSRQMEYHADLHEIRLCGSEIFETTTNKFATLSEALQRTYKEMRVRWNSSHILPESLPAALRVTHAELPVGVVDKIHSRLGLQRSGIFATHPSPGDRIRQSRRAAAPGIFHDDRPATVLFQNFAVAARQVTILHYRDDLGIPVLPEMLEAVESESVQDKPSTGNRIEEPDPFLGLGPLIFPFAENDEPPTADVEDAVREAQDIGDQLVSLATELEPLTRQYGDTHEQWTR